MVSKMVLGIPSNNLMANRARHAPTQIESVEFSAGFWRRDCKEHQTSAGESCQFLVRRFVREVLKTEPAVLMPWLAQASPQPPSAPRRRLACRGRDSTSAPLTAGGW